MNKRQNIIRDYKDIYIRFSEVDSMGIIWHGNYVQYFEDGREFFGEKFGLSYSDIRENGFLVPITKLEADFKNYVKHGTELEIETIFHYSRVAKICFSYNIRNKKTNKLVCSGKSEQVFIDALTYRLNFFKPEFFRKWEERMFENTNF